MIKRILLSIVMLVLIAYLAVAITAFNRKPADQTCRDMELVIKDTAYAGFITKEELKVIHRYGAYTGDETTLYAGISSCLHLIEESTQITFAMRFISVAE